MTTTPATSVDAPRDDFGARWWVAHLFYGVGPTTERGPIEIALKECVPEGHQLVTASILGHKADLAIVVIGPSPAVVRELQTRLRLAGLELRSSYLSLTELSEYAANLPAELAEARLHPVLPPAGMDAFCFYPMSKRREGADNWYSLPYEERLALMTGHGAVGRRFRGRVLQLVTGSTGLDDFEWGVTLFGKSHDDVKSCVYEMRFDEASARFAQFGPFVIGTVGTPEEVLDALHVI